MEEVIDQLQWKKYMTSCNCKCSSPVATEEVVHQLQWKN